jgi:hypothetical protein
VSAIAALLLSGCHLGQPASASFASVKITGHPPEQIQEVTGNVFRGDGYAAFIGGNGQMIFQKEGTRANNISQNGFVGSYYGDTTLFRVIAEIVDLGGGTFRLQCQAYLVRNPGDSFMEDSHPLANIRGGPYQRLLNKVAREVKSMPVAPPPPLAVPPSAPAATK